MFNICYITENNINFKQSTCNIAFLFQKFLDLNVHAHVDLLAKFYHFCNVHKKSICSDENCSVKYRFS